MNYSPYLKSTLGQIELMWPGGKDNNVQALVLLVFDAVSAVGAATAAAAFSTTEN